MWKSLVYSLLYNDSKNKLLMAFLYLMEILLQNCSLVVYLLHLWLINISKWQLQRKLYDVIK